MSAGVLWVREMARRRTVPESAKRIIADKKGVVGSDLLLRYIVAIHHPHRQEGESGENLKIEGVTAMRRIAEPNDG